LRIDAGIALSAKPSYGNYYLTVENGRAEHGASGLRVCAVCSDPRIGVNMMNRKQKQETVDRILDLLMQLIEEEHPQTGRSKPVEMITIKEAVSTIQGISEHTIRMLVAQNRVHYIRTGEGKRGKILISKESLLEYFGVVA
jgi:hypothetical protein